MQVGFYALVGMGAVLAAVVHAPLASILILFEVTQERGVVLPAMLATVVATGLARLIFPDSIYTLSLRRRGVQVGTNSDLRILRRLTVDQVQLEPVASVTSNTPFDELVKRTADNGTIDFVVFDKSGNYTGLVTADEVREALLSPESIPLLLASEVVRGDVPCVRSSDDLAAVLETFSRFEVGRLPVCVANNPGHIIGLISRGADAAIPQSIARELSIETPRINADERGSVRSFSPIRVHLRLSTAKFALNRFRPPRLAGIPFCGRPSGPCRRARMLRVHLADARFGQVERRADFLHRHLFEVVEDDDQPLGAAEALGDQFLQVLALDLADRVGAAACLPARRSRGRPCCCRSRTTCGDSETSADGRWRPWPSSRTRPSGP